MEAYTIPLDDASKFAYTKLSKNTKKKDTGAKILLREIFTYLRQVKDPCVAYDCPTNEPDCLGNNYQNFENCPRATSR